MAPFHGMPYRGRVCAYLFPLRHRLGKEQRKGGWLLQRGRCRRGRRKRGRAGWKVLAVCGLLALGVVLLLVGKGGGTPPERQLQVLWPDGQVGPVELETFLVGVVAGEMPVSFGEQALQAQAIAARTYLVRQAQSGKHGEAAVCCDSACCQAWISPKEMEGRWGRACRENLQQVRAAVAATAGLILTWEGAPIDAVFCSTCGGYTEAAAELWGSPRRYLTAHPCPYCGASPKLCGQRRFSLEEAARLLETTPEGLRDMTVLSRTAGGRVRSLRVGERCWTGAEVRAKLGLASAAFSWLLQGEDLVVLTLGYGHGVGLCQYGAAGMARSGAKVWEILAFYYPGARLETLDRFYPQ